MDVEGRSTSGSHLGQMHHEWINCRKVEIRQQHEDPFSICYVGWKFDNKICWTITTCSMAITLSTTAMYMFGVKKGYVHPKGVGISNACPFRSASEIANS